MPFGYRKPRIRIGRSPFPATVVGDRSPASVGPLEHNSRPTQRRSKERKKRYTAAEKAFEAILKQPRARRVARKVSSRVGIWPLDFGLFILGKRARNRNRWWIPSIRHTAKT